MFYNGLVFFLCLNFLNWRRIQIVFLLIYTIDHDFLTELFIYLIINFVVFISCFWAISKTILEPRRTKRARITFRSVTLDVCHRLYATLFSACPMTTTEIQLKKSKQPQ